MATSLIRSFCRLPSDWAANHLAFTCRAVEIHLQQSVGDLSRPVIITVPINGQEPPEYFNMWGPYLLEQIRTGELLKNVDGEVEEEK